MTSAVFTGGGSLDGWTLPLGLQADGTAPPQVLSDDVLPSRIRRGPEGLLVTVTVADVYALTVPQPATGPGPFLYRFRGRQPDWAAVPTTVAATALQSAVLSDSPVAYWTLTGGSAGLADRTGNGHTATPTGSPTTGTFLDGTGCTVFNGTSQYITTVDADDLSVVTTGSLTIEAWMRPGVTDYPVAEGTGPYVHWMGKGGASGGYEYASRMYNLTSYRPQRISGYCFNLTGNLGAGSYFQETEPVGTWIHYALAINTVNTSATYPTGYTKVFKNGLLRDQDSLSGYSIVPGNGTDPFRIATIDLNSLFEGAICNVAIYPTELSAARIRAHYRTIVPAVAGTAEFLFNVGTTVQTGTVSFADIAAPANIPAGSTVVVRATHPFTTGAATCADTRGNVYTADRTSSSSGLNIRTTVFSGQINVQLTPGDFIRVSTPVSVGTLAAEADAFTNVVFGGAAANVDAFNSTSGTSTTPGNPNPAVTTTHADDLLVGTVAVQGPSTDTYTEDTILPWVSLTSAGSSGATTDFTLHSAYDPVAATGTYRYEPVLGTSRNWIEILGSYKAGTPTVTPPTPGTALFIQNIDAQATTALGTTLTLTVPALGVPAGHTIIVRILTDFEAASPVVSDTRSNTWTVNRTSPDTGNTMRGSIASATISTALQGGDHITVTTGSLHSRVAVADEFASLLSPLTVDVSNGATGTSTTPQLGSGLTTLHADDLLIGAAFAEGPPADSYSEDVLGQWTSLTRAGTTGSSTNDMTINSAWRAVGSTGSYNYKPVLGTSRIWIDFVVAYEAT